MADAILEHVEKIKVMIDAYGKDVKQTQDMLSANDEKLENFSKGTIEKAAEAATKNAEQIVEIKKEFTAVEKTVQFLQKTLSRTGAAKDNEEKDFEEKAGYEMTQYLRSAKPMSEEVVEKISIAMSSKGLFGVSDEERQLHIKTITAGNNPRQGYWIRPERSTVMIRRFFETSPIRSIAGITSTGSDTLEYIIDDNEVSTGGWVGETSPRGNTEENDIGLLTIPIHEQFAQPRVTQKMLDDSGFDLESYLTNKVTDKMTRFENTSFVVGDGAQKPRGFLSLPAWAVNGVYERGKLEQIVSGAAGEFTGDGVKNLQNSLLEIYQAGATFVTKRKNWGDIIILKDGLGAYLLDPRSFKVGDDLTLLGKPVMFADDVPDVANDSLSLVYGDFGIGYTIVDRFGFRVIRDELTNKPNILFYTTKRVGGDVTNYQSIKIQRLSA